MNATAPRRRVTDAFDPMAVGMLARYAPSTLAGAFGQDVARSAAPTNLSETMAAVWSRSGRSGRPDVMVLLTDADFQLILKDTVSIAALAAYILNRPAILDVSRETHDIENFKPVSKSRVASFRRCSIRRRAARSSSARSASAARATRR